MPSFYTYTPLGVSSFSRDNNYDSTMAFLRENGERQWVVLSSPDTGFATRIAFQTFCASAGWQPQSGISSPVWHTPPAPLAWAGRYIPCIRVGNAWHAKLDESGVPISYDCPHCAASNSDEGVFVCSHDGNVYEAFRPPAPEIIGETSTGLPTTTKNVTEIPRGCGNCGLLGHNARTCERPQKAHDKVGIEVEGKWLDLRTMRRKADEEGLGNCSDGSLSDSNTCQAWEFQTKPGTMREALQQLVDFYPDETDRYCGMHVHVSFGAHDLCWLSTQEFFAYWKARWTAWGERMHIHTDSQFWRRLRGDIDYCQPNTSTPENLRNVDRYVQLNFSAWNEHKTVECRLLPMFQKQSLGVAAVQELLAIYEDFLANPGVHVLFGEQTVAVEKPDSALHSETFELDLPVLAPESESFELVMEEILPPREGMVRLPLRALAQNNLERYLPQIRSVG